MRALKITVRFLEVTAENQIASRALDCAEALYRELYGKRIAVMSDPVSFDGEFAVTVPAQAKIRRVEKLVRDHLVEYNLADSATVEITEA